MIMFFCFGLRCAFLRVCVRVGLNSVSTVHKHVHSLVNKGWFLPYIGKNRTILPNEELLDERAK